MSDTTEHQRRRKHSRVDRLPSAAMSSGATRSSSPRPIPSRNISINFPRRRVTSWGAKRNNATCWRAIERGAVITGLRGMGGIGKTALALVIAHQLKARYADAQFFLDLRGAGDNPVTPLRGADTRRARFLSRLQTARRP